MEFNKNMLWKENDRTEWKYNQEFIDFLKFKLKNPISISSLAKEIGIDSQTLKRIINKNKLEVIKTKYDLNYEAIYQSYEWCYQKFIIEGLNHKEMAEEANCSIRVIEKWCTEKHKLTTKYRMMHKQLNDLQHSLIVGSMLGDGHIDKRKTQPIFIVSHAEDQKDYLYWKYDILKDLCNIPPSIKKEEIRYFFGKGYKCKKQYRLCTRIYDCLKLYRSMRYYNLLQIINEFSLSIWLLDDGSRYDSNWELCVAEYTEEEINLAINILKKRFDLEAHQEKDDRYILFNAESSRKIDKMILSNIPNQLDIIKNKIIDNRNIKDIQKRIFVNIDGIEILLTNYCIQNNLNYSRIINRTYKGLNIYESINLERSKYNG